MAFHHTIPSTFPNKKIATSRPTMGKSYCEVEGVIQIIQKTCSLLRRSNKIFLSAVLVAMIPYTLLLFGNIFSLTSVVQDLYISTLSITHMDDEAVEYLRQAFNSQVKTFLIIVVQILCFHLMAMFSLMSLVSTVNVSGRSYLEKDLKLKELSLKIKRIWVRPLITWFYLNLLFTSLVLLILLEKFCQILNGGSVTLFTAGIILLFLVSGLSFYLALVWNVGLVTSMLEDLCGLEAFGNERMLVGLILMFIFGVPINAWYISMFLTEIFVLIIFLALSFVFMMNIVSMMTDTAYYFESKQVARHSEIENTEISASLLEV